MAEKLLGALDMFAGIQKHGQDIESEFANRNTVLDAIEKMFMMDWTTPSDSELKGLVTVSPAVRNAAVGAVRLLTAADPSFSIPYDKNAKAMHKGADAIERFCNALYYQMSRLRGRPLHYKAATSAVLFDELHIGVTSTADMLAVADKTKKAQYSRIERLADVVPYVWEVYDPRTCYPTYDALGLASFYRKVELKSGEVLDRYGERAVAVGLNPESRFDDVDLCEYWDNDIHAVWIDGNSTPLICAEHGLPCMPVWSGRASDADLFSSADYSSQPFLYTAYKSGMWERSNLALTVMSAAIFRFGAFPNFATTDENVDVDFSKLGGMVYHAPGTEFGQVDKRPVDPALWQFSELLESGITDSTIYKQTLGEPLGANAPYSMLALLNQAGRLPLVPIQRLMVSGFSGAMGIVLDLMKDGGTQARVGNKAGEVMKLKPSDIPDGTLVDCRVDIQLPQDDRQNAQMAIQLMQMGLPKRYIAETYLNAGQWNELQQEAYEEQATEAFLQAQLQMQIQAMQQQGAMQAQQGAMMGQPGMDQGQGMPPEMMAQMQGQPPMGQPPMGQPGMGGGELPPEMMQALQAQAMQQQGMMGQQQMTATDGMPLSEPLPPEGMG